MPSFFRRSLLMFMACISLVCVSCIEEEEEEALGDPVNGMYSCRYTNKFAGQDCKSFIGAYWADAEARESNCGSGFVEENAYLSEDPCPDTLEYEGKHLPAIGGCHAYEGEPEEIFVISYEGEAESLQWACETYMEGTWELM